MEETPFGEKKTDEGGAKEEKEAGMGVLSQEKETAEELQFGE